MARKAAFRKKQKSSKVGTLIIISVFAMLATAIGINSRELEAKRDKLVEKQEALEQQIKEQEEYSKELEHLKKYTKTKKYAEEVAKEKLGLVYSDEIVFKPQE